MFNQHLIDKLEKHDITIAAVTFCPHHPEISGNCACRKPATGLLDDIEKQLGEKIDWTLAWGIGDKPADSQMMLTKGGRAVLIASGPRNNTAGEVYWTKNDPKLADLLANKRNFTADITLLRIKQYLSSKVFDPGCDRGWIFNA